MTEDLAVQLNEQLQAIPVFDAHTHLVGGKLGARGLHDILLYHMVVADLQSAGCPDFGRLSEYPLWPDRQEASRRIESALPYLRHIENTSCFWGVRIILRDLYDWREPITPANWRTLDDLIRSRADDRDWHRQIMRRANIARFSSELARREAGLDDDIIQYSLEWAFFTRCQWGEFDTALYELERCWGRPIESPMPIKGGGRPKTDRVIRTLADVQAAMSHYVATIPYDKLISMATHFSTDIDLEPVTDAQMSAALARRDQAGPAERDIYASYVNEAFLQALRPHAGKIVFQFSLAAEPLPTGTASRIHPRTIEQRGRMIAAHPDIRFQCFLAAEHANQSLCTFCRELPNFSLSGYWWHNFFPWAIRRLMEERLDMVAANKQVGFFSDAYCVEWSYAKLLMVRRQLAEVLAAKVRQGQYTREQALQVARDILYESPQTLLGMRHA